MLSTKTDRAKGFVQLVLVIGFIAGSFMLANALKSTKTLPGERASQGAKRTLVETAEIAPEPYHVTFEVTGLVEAPSTLQLSPEVSGRVVRVSPSARSGANFEAGMPLFQIDSRDYELAVAQRKSELAQARTAYELEKAEAEVAVKEWQVLHGGKEVPVLVSRAPQLAQAEAAMASAKAALENAKQDLVKTSFIFPFDGVVVESDIVEGQFLQVGQSYGTAYSAKDLQVRATLNAEQLSWVLAAPDAEATLQVTHLGNTHTLKITPRKGDVFVDATTRFAPVYFDFEQREAFLFPGQLATLRLNGPEHTDVMRLPVSALQTDGNVWKYTNEGRIEPFTPEILYRDNTHVAIQHMDKPLTIVTSRLSGAIPGMHVERLGEESEK